MNELLCADLDCSVVEASNGLEAWDLLDKGLIPDLCIFALRMPKMGGLELVTRLRSDSRFKSLKILLCSTLNNRSTIINAASLDVTAYVLKPFLTTDFLDHNRKLVGEPPSSVPANEFDPIR